MNDRPKQNRWFLFSQETTLHGLKGTTDNGKPVFIRLFWLSVLLAGFCGWLYTSIDLAFQISKHKTRTVFKREYRQYLDFPTITLCLSCPLSVNNINITEEFRQIFIATSSWRFLRSSGPELNQTTFDYRTLAGMIADATSTLGDSIYLVKWDGKELNPDKVFETLPLDEKTCFQFNGEMYQKKFGTFITDVGGSKAGLEIVADVLQSGCPASIFDTAGLEVYIQSPFDYAVPSSPDLVLAPGVATYITLSQSQTLFLPYPYKAVGDSYCLDTSLPEYQNYSKVNCFNTCYDKELQKVCPCAPSAIFDIEKKKNLENCKNVTDAVACWSLFSDSLTRQIEKGELFRDCDCPEPCRKTEYRHEFSFAYFPTDALADRLVEVGAISNRKYARKNLLKFHMNFKDRGVNIIEYIPEYGSSEILGIVGGQLGLFLGASLITATEIVETIILSIYYRIRSCSVAKTKVHSIK